MERIFDLKFIVPPLITMIIVGGFVFLVNPDQILSWFQKVQPFQPLAVAIGSAVILILGFLISSITTLIINRFFTPDYYDNKDRECLKKRFHWIEGEFTRKNPKNIHDICCCEVAGLETRSDIEEKYIQTTHDMAMVNFYSFTAIVLGLLLSIIILCIINLPFCIFIKKYGFFILILILLFLFLYNGRRTREKVKQIDKILVRKDCILTATDQEESCSNQKSSLKI
jgi:uncharacterized protein YacL